ncbi:MAG: hypothetical protein O2U62_03730 [Candidatus Bathyarchaeota archaeon]|nr:hypothetical protein [Candidatus Bathyarchaeota archaeon]
MSVKATPITTNGTARASKLDEADASLDSDGDDLTNLEECQEDTDPNVSEGEAFPLWIVGVAALLIGIADVVTLFWRRRK